MRNIRRIGIAITCMTLIGCGNTLHLIYEKAEHKNSSSLIVGKTLETKIGEVMVANEDLYFLDGYIAINSYQPKPQSFMGTINYLPISKGVMFYKFGKLDNGDVVYKSIDEFRAYGGGWQDSTVYCILENQTGEPYGDAGCDFKSYCNFIRKWDDKPNFLVKEKVYKKGKDRKEIIYLGKAKDTIKLAYREYTNNLARPAFSQDLIYDLSESKSISFRSMNIEVIEATNSSISFIVKSPME